MKASKKDVQENKTSESFIQFFTKKEQKISLLYLFAFYCIVYIGLIYLYPFPDGISDSNGYIDAAIQGQYTGFRPFGYSKFLIALHGFSTSVSFVVFVQFWLNAITSVLFVQAIKYLFKPKNKILQVSLDLFSVLSIATIYLSNCILSDSLFTSLTTLWILTGIGFIQASTVFKKSVFFLIHLILLGFLFSIRFTALFYLFVTLVFVFLSLYKISKWRFLLYSLFAVLLISGLYIQQENTTEELTGVRTYSGFSGWQMANNAMHVVPHISIDTNQIKDIEVKKFASFVLRFNKFLPIPAYNTSPEYIWTKEAVLKQFLAQELNENRSISYLEEWTYLGKNVYSKFGNYILLNYPVEYFQYYFLQNMAGVFYPRFDDVLTEYEQNAISIDLLKKWFDVEPEASFYSKSNIVGNISKYLPFQKLILFILLVLSIFIRIFIPKKQLFSSIQNKTYFVLLFFILSFLLFQSYAATCFIRHSMTIHIETIAAIYIVLNSCFTLKEKKIL